VLGENGTGKEMVARALHRRSQQRNGPFVAINRNAIPENLLEREEKTFQRERRCGGLVDAVDGEIPAVEPGAVLEVTIGSMRPVSARLPLAG
jgi:transcriptional regulator with AAA-type ATPase domain